MQALLERMLRNTNVAFEPLSGPKTFVFKDKLSVHKRSKDNVSIRLWKILRLLKGLKNPEVTKKSLNFLKSYLLIIQCYNLHTCLKDLSRFRSSYSFQLENFPWKLRLQTIQGLKYWRQTELTTDVRTHELWKNNRESQGPAACVFCKPIPKA